jgi:hypothetical protein
MRELRFGIMCFGTNFAAWEAECIRKLLAVDNVHSCLLIVDNRPNPVKPPAPFWTRARNLLRADKKLWLLYERLYSDPRTVALRRTDAADLLAGVPRVECEIVRKGKYSEYFKPGDVAKIREYNLDFILRFAFGIIRGEVLQAVRYGVWSFHHGDEERYRGTPSGFWEIYQGDPKTGVILQRLTDRLDGGVVLKKHFFDTVDYSYPANRNATLFGASHWPAEVCRDIQKGEAAYFENPPSKTSAPVTMAPVDWQMIVFLIRILNNALRRRRGGA